MRWFTAEKRKWHYTVLVGSKEELTKYLRVYQGSKKNRTIKDPQNSESVVGISWYNDGEEEKGIFDIIEWQLDDLTLIESDNYLMDLLDLYKLKYGKFTHQDINYIYNNYDILNGKLIKTKRPWVENI